MACIFIYSICTHACTVDVYFWRKIIAFDKSKYRRLLRKPYARTRTKIHSKEIFYEWSLNIQTSKTLGENVKKPA
jgi:hypothetical protein